VDELAEKTVELGSGTANRVWAYVFMGDMYRDFRRLDEAIAAYRQEATYGPESWWYYRKFGMAQVGKNRVEEASRAYQAVSKFFPDMQLIRSTHGQFRGMLAR
jgi:tetratricopeptide (TPR) repeat protein